MRWLLPFVCVCVRCVRKRAGIVLAAGRWDRAFLLFFFLFLTDTLKFYVKMDSVQFSNFLERAHTNDATAAKRSREERERGTTTGRG